MHDQHEGFVPPEGTLPDNVIEVDFSQGSDTTDIVMATMLAFSGFAAVAGLVYWFSQSGEPPAA